jgi:PAS domain S-box-containing protein
MDPLVGLLRANEDDMLGRVFALASRHGYTRYSSTLVEAWRASVHGLADALIIALEENVGLDFGVDDDLSLDPVTRFGRESALRHRSRGVTLPMFLGLTKYYRDAFADSCTADTDDQAERARRRHVISRLFDRIELGFCEAWSKADAATGSAELQTANRDLANEKNRYLTVLESIREAVFVVGEGGAVQYANPPALALAGQDVAPGGGRYGDALAVLNTQRPAWLTDLVREQRRDSVQLDVTAAQATHTFVAQTTPVLDITQKTAGVVVVLRDLTELREADRERRELQAVFDAVARSAGDGIVMVDEHGHIAFWNRAAEQMFGWSRDEVLGRNPHGFLTMGPPPTDAQQRALTRPTGPRTFTAKRRDGSKLDIELTLSDVPVGPVHHTLGVVRDITERRRVEAQAHASSRLEAVGRLAGGIAHEINTPVQFVGDSLFFLRDATNTLCGLTKELQAHAAVLPRNDPWVASLDAHLADLDVPFLLEEAPRAIERAVEGVGRVADIVRAMKEFGHPGSGKHAPADLNRAVRNTLLVSRPSWKYVATNRFEEGELPPVMCRVEQVSQVVLNLIVNAGDAIRERGEQLTPGLITVRTRVDGPDVVIEVEDTGVGISPAHEPQLFQPFFTTKEPGRGTGQGLALSRHIVVDTHQGSITFKSTAGVGTTFTVRLPVAGRPSTALTPAPQFKAVGS